MTEMHIKFPEGQEHLKRFVDELAASERISVSAVVRCAIALLEAELSSKGLW
jgi:hypothetical protein